MNIFGGTRRSTSAYAKATADALFAFIHGQSQWLSAKAGKRMKKANPVRNSKVNNAPTKWGISNGANP
jgi:hypothetical protein